MLAMACMAITALMVGYIIAKKKIAPAAAARKRVPLYAKLTIALLILCVATAVAGCNGCLGIGGATIEPTLTPTPVITLAPTPTPTPTPSPDPTPEPTPRPPGLIVTNTFIPSGWWDDYGDLKFDRASVNNPYSGESCVKISYSAAKSQGKGYAEVCWQYPENNNGNAPGLNLNGNSQVTFYVRGEKGGEKVEFKVGGTPGSHGDLIMPGGIDRPPCPDG